MSCLVEDFRFCLLIGVGGILVLKGGGSQNCRVALNLNQVLMAAAAGKRILGHLDGKTGAHWNNNSML